MAPFQPDPTKLQCPHCGSDKIYRNGTHQLVDGTERQRYICRTCTYRFRFPPEYTLKSIDDTIDDNQISAKQVKNLEPQLEKTIVVGENTNIDAFLTWMKNQGYREATIYSRGKRLRRLQKLGANLNDPESVKATIANQVNWKEGMKEAAVFAYDLYAKRNNITWERPRYKAIRQLPFIPQEREIDDLIAGVNREIALLLLIAKDTGARAGEVFNLKWTDIDFVAHTISISPEKNSNPRMCRMSKRLQNVLECYPQRQENIFCQYKTLLNLRRTFERQRTRLSIRLANPRLNKITIHTLRHWKATTEYSKTKDILYVMQVMGHKNIKNTLLYTQLIQGQQDTGYICKIAQTPQEAVVLIEDGFELHCSYGENDSTKLFRKKKL